MKQNGAHAYDNIDLNLDNLHPILVQKLGLFNYYSFNNVDLHSYINDIYLIIIILKLIIFFK